MSHARAGGSCTRATRRKTKPVDREAARAREFKLVDETWNEEHKLAEMLKMSHCELCLSMYSASDRPHQATCDAG